MHYQPKFELKTGNLVGAEALLRWEHPTGMIYPDSFIFIAEKTGLITEIGAWVLQEVAFKLLSGTSRALLIYMFL